MLINACDKIHVIYGMLNIALSVYVCLVMKKQDDILKVFGQNVKARRVEKEWTQKDLAFELNWEPSYISRIEAGAANLSLTKVGLLAAALGCKPSELISPM